MLAARFLDRQSENRRRNAGAASGDDGLGEIDAMRGKSLRRARRAGLSLPCSTISTNGRFRLPGIWPLFRPGRGSGGFAAKSLGGASVDDLRRTGSPALCAHRPARRRNCDRAGRRNDAAGGLGSPSSSGRPSLIHLGRPPSRILTSATPKARKRPPDPRGGEQAERVIDDHMHAVAEAKLAHRRGESDRLGQHMRQAARRVGDRCRCRRTPRRECGRREIRLRRCARSAADARRRRSGQGRARPNARASHSVVDEIRRGHGAGSLWGRKRIASVQRLARRSEPAFHDHGRAPVAATARSVDGGRLAVSRRSCGASLH